MDRVVKASPVYLGLFLMMFALYAAEKTAVHPTLLVAPEVQSLPEEGETPESPLLNVLFRKLKALPVLKNRIEGLSLKRIKPGILLSVETEDLFRDGQVDLAESWHPIYEAVFATILTDAPSKVHVQIRAYANGASATESQSFALGVNQNPYLLSAARADWLLHAMQSKFHFKLDTSFSIAGGGVIPHGKRLDLLISDSRL